MTSNVSKVEIAKIYHLPLLELIVKAANVHRENNDGHEVQMCSLLSIKTGGCSEDCSYCPQSAHYDTQVKAQPLMKKEDVLAFANRAKSAGASRLCMGAAWRQARDNTDFAQVLEYVSEVNQMGLEVCCTLGMLSEKQAQQLADAGLYAYNHNVDTSAEFYSTIITTRKYQDRLATIQHVQQAGISVCSGGILGLGESEEDRIGMLHTLVNLNPPPDSIPINALVAVEGTPLAAQSKVSIFEMVRMIATTRLLLPKTVIRLSAGRTQMSEADQALCFLAGANSIFMGEKLLTTPNPSAESDLRLLTTLGLTARPPFKDEVRQA